VLAGRLVANDWFITVVVSPRFSPARPLQATGPRGRRCWKRTDCPGK
jgi:hypothetical protein